MEIDKDRPYLGSIVFGPQDKVADGLYFRELEKPMKGIRQMFSTKHKEPVLAKAAKFHFGHLLRIPAQAGTSQKNEVYINLERVQSIEFADNYKVGIAVAGASYHHGWFEFQDKEACELLRLWITQRLFTGSDDE